jgi:hypothetical protein
MLAPSLRPAARAVPVAALVALLVAPAGAGAASIPSPGRYKGMTGDGHVFEFTVAPSAKPGFARKITHFWLVYDIAGCRSGPVRQPFFTSVRTTGPAAAAGSSRASSGSARGRTRSSSASPGGSPRPRGRPAASGSGSSAAARSTPPGRR